MKYSLLAFASALLSSTTAFAQPAAQSGLKLSTGVGAIVGFRIEGPNETADGGLGLYLRGGVHLSEVFGIEDDLATTAGIIPLAGVSFLVRDAIDLTVTPVDWLTLAAGPTFSWGLSESASTAGGTLRVDFHFPRQRAANGARRASTLGLAGDLADVVKRDGAGGGVAWGAFLTFGYAWY
jgi:hypothetical protein